MPNPIGPDGITVSGYGWTNQSTAFNSNKNLESGGPASSATTNGALRRGYSAQTFEPYLAAGTAITTSTTLAQLIYVPTTFSCANVDLIVVANTGNTTVALWPSTAPAGTATPLAWSAATAAVATSVNTFTFGGSSSPASVSLTGGNYYFVTVFGAATAPTLAAAVTPASYVTNAAASGTYTAATTYFTATVGTVTTVSAASVFGTSTLGASSPWIGLH